MIQLRNSYLYIGGSDADFALARYNVDGSLDSSFGSGGKIITTFSNSVDAAFDLAIQNDGKIVVVGYSNGASYFTLVRYNVDGNLDPTFGSGGKVLSQFGTGSQSANAVTLQKDGKIVAAGFVGRAGHDFVIARYKSDGNLDPNFGSGGKIITDFFGGADHVNDVALQADGKIIVAGDISNSVIISNTEYDFGLARYNSDGSLDTTFGSGGKTSTDFFNLNDRPFGMAIQAHSKIIVAGFASVSPTNWDIALVRYNNVVFDLCLQDDSTGNILKISSTTGDYLFTTCSGFTIGGTGTLSKRGCTISFQDSRSDRRIMAKIDTCQNKATASVQMFAQGSTFTLTDKNITNNSCTCPNSN